MNDTAIRVEHLSKKFRRGEDYDSLRELIPAFIAGLGRRRDPEQLTGSEFWALRDVSFEIADGRAVGVIGHNGAGKSTLLKHLTGLLRPTAGSMHVNRRVSALIEVGAGFHGDLTGRENIFLNGAILGMSVVEIRSKFDAIVEFSGLERFLDTPVKRYSSGMFAKLGFSVAAHLDPEILLIDEVLSVGDFAFQKKCIEKMRSIVQGGATVIFVSHNLRSVVDLCDRCLLLHGGRLIEDGLTNDVIHRYMEVGGSGVPGREPNGIAFDEIQVLVDGRPERLIQAGQRFVVRVRGRAVRDVSSVEIGFVWYDAAQYEVSNLSSSRFGYAPLNLRAGDPFEVAMSFAANLCSGAYDLAVSAWQMDREASLDRRPQAATIQVAAPPEARGLVFLDARAERPAGGA
jgi:lipopolysaccharide transport system ATP-binding protein